MLPVKILKKMKVFITGATGLIGSQLSRRIIERGDSVTVLTRDAARAKNKLGDAVKCVSSLGDMENLDAFDAVINLCGENIGDKRWTPLQKSLIENSRWHPTEKIAELIRRGANPPKVLISGSAVGWYGPQKNKILSESSAPQEGGFLQGVCAKWENLARSAESEHTRVCVLRTGIVLAGSGGMLAKIAPIFKTGLGAKLGGGGQYVSWIHIDDMARAILFLLDNSSANGAFNMCSPEPVKADVFYDLFAGALGRKCRFRIPEWLLRAVFGERADIMLDSSRAVPVRLGEMSFSFEYPLLEKAFAQIAKSL